MYELKLRIGVSILAPVRSASAAGAWLLVSVALLAVATPLYANCTYVVVPTTVPFGDYSVFSNPSSSAPEFIVQIRCNPNTSGTLTLSRSSTNNSFNPRAMALTSAGDRVRYNVFLDAAGTQIFGDGQGGTTASISVNAEPNEKTFFIPMYFRTTAEEDAPAGTYTDTLTLTLNPTKGNEAPTRTFTVTTVVVPECSVQTFSLNFGTYDPIGAHLTSPLDAVANTPVNVYCTKGVQATTTLSQGNNFAESSRRMAFGTHRLSYGVFLDSNHTTAWSSVGPAASTSRNTALAWLGHPGYPVFGRIPAGQVVAAGSYSDTLVATVTY
jgi:spore coat protein U-like protein